MKSLSRQILLIPSVAFCIYCLCSTTTAAAMTAAARQDNEPIVEQAKDLINEYKKDVCVADAKYKSKLMTVTGKLGATINAENYE